MASAAVEQNVVLPYKPAKLNYKGHTIETSLNYYKDPGDGSAPTPVKVGKTTVTNERPTAAQTVAVKDISGQEDQYSLDSHGFQLIKRQTKFADFADEGKLKKDYFADVEQLLKDVTGASRVFVFDHKVRHGPTNWHSLGQNNAAQRGPLHRVHIDQSNDGAVMILKQVLPDEAEKLVGRRWQIINVWRPIKTIRKDPLAVADSNTVPDSDLVPASIIYADHRRESFTVLPNPAHRWYFKYHQEPSEVMLIKCFDTVQTGSHRVPHSAFSDPDEVDAEDRESVEVRALVFY